MACFERIFIMRSKKAWMTLLAVIGIGLIAVGGAVSLAQSDEGYYLWETLGVTVDENGVFNYSRDGVAYARAFDASVIRISGSGRFGPTLDDPVDGGGSWATFDKLGVPTGMGEFTVTGLVYWTEAPGIDPTDPAMYHDPILEEFGLDGTAWRAGLAVLTVEYTDELGNVVDSGTLMVSCSLPVDSPPSIIEGLAATKGHTLFYDVIAPVPDNGFSYTLFYFIPE
jgi:hypothetical protein